MSPVPALPLAAGVDVGTVLLVVGLLVVFVLLVILLKFFKIWIQAYFSNANISLFDLVGMWLRRVNASTIVQSKIALVQANLPAETKDLEAHYLAGGNVESVARALIAADRARIPMDFKTAAGIDLAGRDVLDAIQTSVNPKVIDCPDPRKDKREVAAVAKDGIQVLARARVTVRTNLSQLVGGATEETIIARVGEGIVSTIGSAASHKSVLENPDMISKTVLAKGLDAGTAFTILSIDIADVDIGQNIGARLQADQAEADKRVAQAKAEERRALAVAHEQENRALVVENEAKVRLAEAEIPMAVAEALRAGRMGVMDWYRLRNVEADTKMRDSLGGPDAGRPGDGSEG
ncbi:MAG: flotillin-like protein FloA [Planctomycetes bacterium]|nr:flotillin-like protein FloA [Planctomycetota bacterium]MCB9825963.1 flotillin-like protein FloA [Planctomycetota bacterium]MCB9901640.1 flotillin-like protein FloA [Planctomycetota bacterium]